VDQKSDAHLLKLMTLLFVTVAEAKMSIVIYSYCDLKTKPLFDKILKSAPDHYLAGNSFIIFLAPISFSAIKF